METVPLKTINEWQYSLNEEIISMSYEPQKFYIYDNFTKDKTEQKKVIEAKNHIKYINSYFTKCTE